MWNGQASPADEHVAALDQDTGFTHAKRTLQEPPHPNRPVAPDNLQKGFCIAVVESDELHFW